MTMSGSRTSLGRSIAVHAILGAYTIIAMTAAPKALPFIQAIKACDPELPLTLALTATGRLAVKSGKFKVFVDCTDAAGVEKFMPKPEGVALPLIQFVFSPMM